MAPDIEPIDTQVLATLVANMIQAYLTGTPSPSRTEEVFHDNASNPVASPEDGVRVRAAIDDGAGTEPSGEYRAAICSEGQGTRAGMAGHEHAYLGRGSGNLGCQQQRSRRLQEVAGRGVAGRSRSRVRLGGLASGAVQRRLAPFDRDLCLDRHADRRRGRLLQSRGFQRRSFAWPEGPDVSGRITFPPPPPPGRQAEQSQER